MRSQICGDEVFYFRANCDSSSHLALQLKWHLSNLLFMKLTSPEGLCLFGDYVSEGLELSPECDVTQTYIMWCADGGCDVFKGLFAVCWMERWSTRQP